MRKGQRRSVSRQQAQGGKKKESAPGDEAAGVLSLWIWEEEEEPPSATFLWTRVEVCGLRVDWRVCFQVIAAACSTEWATGLGLSALFVCHLCLVGAYFKQSGPDFMRIDTVGLDFYSWRAKRGRSLLCRGSYLKLKWGYYPVGG
jgi:hypothetical protein